jgi:DUF1365 family protein
VVTPAPGIYTGTIRHRRFAPRPHRFEYALFMVLLDIDRVPETMARSRLTSHNRWNWATFDDRDHLADREGPLRARLGASAAAAGVALPAGPIYLLTHLRYTGYVFNPISLFYCHDSAGVLRMVLAEVSNTYGGRRDYWLEPEAAVAGPFRSRAGKALYVSPFMPEEASYEFVLTAPGPTLIAHMNVVPPDQPRRARLFDATLRLAYQPWTAATMRRTLLQFPWITAKVIAAIHWEALRLRINGHAVHPFRAGGPR